MKCQLDPFQEVVVVVALVLAGVTAKDTSSSQLSPIVPARAINYPFTQITTL